VQNGEIKRPAFDAGARKDNDFKLVFATALWYHMQINVLSGVENWADEAKTYNWRGTKHFPNNTLLVLSIFLEPESNIGIEIIYSFIITPYLNLTQSLMKKFKIVCIVITQ